MKTHVLQALGHRTELPCSYNDAMNEFWECPSKTASQLMFEN
jgi:hypothetical protein